jgi:hypothetical protein
MGQQHACFTHDLSWFEPSGCWRLNQQGFPAGISVLGEAVIMSPFQLAAR